MSHWADQLLGLCDVSYWAEQLLLGLCDVSYRAEQLLGLRNVTDESYGLACGTGMK